MSKRRAFSYYDVEKFLRDAGAERINEKAVVSFEEELQNTVKELVSEAEIYAKYAGRNRTITDSDIRMAKSCRGRRIYIPKRAGKMVHSIKLKKRVVEKPVIQLSVMRSEQRGRPQANA